MMVNIPAPWSIRDVFAGGWFTVRAFLCFFFGRWGGVGWGGVG